MATESSRLLKGVLVSLLVLVVSSSPHEYTVDPCMSSCEGKVTLSTVVKDPVVYLTSDTTLTFLPGTHILDHDGPVVISDVSNLTLQGDGEIQDGFHWTVKQSNVFITCRNSTGGFVFNHSSVHIEGLTITDCGTTGYNGFLMDALQPYTNGLYSESFNVSIYSQIGTVLFFIDCLTVRLGSYLSVQNCSGNCLTFFNTYAINMNHVYVAHNSPEQYKAMNCCDAHPETQQSCVGGGAFFYYVDTPGCLPGNYTDKDQFNLTINMSSFSFSAGPGSSEEVIVSGITVFDIFLSILNVRMNSVMLYDNSGGNFGVISTHSNFTLSNISSLLANQYLRSVCPSVALGISFKFSITNDVICPQATMSLYDGSTFASVVITNSVFSDNLAVDSAGINIDTSFVIDFLHIEAILSFTVENSVILGNGAPLASCIGSGGFIGFPARVIVKLKNIVMTDNYFSEPISSAYLGIPPSCIVLVFTSAIEFENITIANQSLLGIFGINSELHFQQDSLIQNNTGGENGGAIALEANCKFIIHENSIVRLIDNRASLGAGIYIFQPRTVPLIYSLCLFQVAADNGSNSYIYFSGNRAYVTGDVIYGGSLDSCLLFSENKVVPLVIPDLFVVASNQLTRAHYNISSNPIKPCLCNFTTDELLCENAYFTAPTIFPGQSAFCKVAAIGQSEGFTSGLLFVRANFLNYSYEAFYNVSEPVCTLIYVPVRIMPSNTSELKSVPNNFSIAFNVELSSSRTLPATEKFTIVVPVVDCPPGFVVNNSFICKCNSLYDRPDITCDIINNAITLTDNIWIGYDNNKNSSILSDDCPFDYCIDGSVTFNILDSPDRQCVHHRSGILCGGCADGYSLLLGSNECGKCPNNNYLSLLLVFGIAGIALVVLLILLNLTVSVGTINGLIFYANIVQINESVFFPNGRIPALSTFISFLNLDFGYNTCFYSGMTPTIKVWLQFLFPLYLWIIIIVIIIAARYSQRLSRLVGSNAVPVLVTMILLSFTKLSRTLALIFKTATLHFEDGSTQRVWAVDGNSVYGNLSHVVLIVVASMFLLVILLPFTLFAIFAQLQVYMPFICPPCRKFLARLSARFPVFLLRLKPFSDALSGPLKISASYWIGISLASRLLLIFVVSLKSQVILSIVFFIALFFLSIFAILGGVYKSLVNNLLELWALVNILAITVLALADYAKIGTIVSVSLMEATFIAILFLHCYWRVKDRLASTIKEKLFRSSIKRVDSNIIIPHNGKIQKEQQILNDMSASFADNSVSQYREPLLGSSY